jgi:hypothetical protein
VWVNGALVPLGQDGLWKHGISFQGKKMRWRRAQGGSKWGMHIWGTIEMHPPADETILDIGPSHLVWQCLDAILFWCVGDRVCRCGA